MDFIYTDFRFQKCVNCRREKEREREEVLETSILARSILYEHFTKFFVFKSIYNIYTAYMKEKHEAETNKNWIDY